ncbi:TlpA disulfide reductase family protein [Dyadobacter sp. CY312]|uniref:TlpA family protein disulfide reductase n=1 Tax=Dyadobacter sp. CY312 TaxID=2907303 RepID=UPI001F42C1B8|nr:TlpA disulfide reductase family protein [Dyadobacter sp. CY312]MCE7043392.1 TlpA family protein disulfide reductase [Dyadobacter sp. CY312]
MANVSKKVLISGLIIVAAFAVYIAFFKTDSQQIEGQSATATEQPEGVYLSGMSTLDGEQIAMDQEKLVFLNVWATWCGPCNMEMPGIQKLYDKYKTNEKVAFYIVSDEDSETVNPFIARKGYQLPFYRFTGAYPTALDGNAIPRTYIIYKGKILAQEVGASQWDRPEIVELIDKNLAEI